MFEDFFASMNLRLNSIEYLLNSLLNSPKKLSEHDCIDADEVASILHISKNTLYKKTCNKTIPFRKEGKKLLFSRRDIDNYLISNEVKTVQQEITEQEDFLLKKKKR